MPTVPLLLRQCIRKYPPYFRTLSVSSVGRVSSVGIGTRYGLDGPGIQSQWGRDFPIQTGPGAYQASYTMDTVSFPRVMRLGRDVDHPSLSSAEVKERIWLYLYSPCGPSWPVLGWTLPLLLPSVSSTWSSRRQVVLTILKSVPILRLYIAIM